MLTGVAVGGIVPLVYSLLGDVAPASRRNVMAALVQIALGGGISMGQVRLALARCRKRAEGGRSEDARWVAV